MDACARVGVEVSAARASGCAVVCDLTRGAFRELGFGRLVPLFGEYVGKRGGLATPFGEYGLDMRPIAMLSRGATRSGGLKPAAVTATNAPQSQGKAQATSNEQRAMDTMPSTCHTGGKPLCRTSCGSSHFAARLI